MNENNPFLDKAKDNSNCTPLTRDQSELLVRAIMGASQLPPLAEVPEEDKSFIMKIIEKRIEVLKLPVSFTLDGMLVLEALSGGNPGRAISLLINCLYAYENKEVSGNELCDLFPYGFYKEEVFCDYVDNYLKPKKIKWAEIY